MFGLRAGGLGFRVVWRVVGTILRAIGAVLGDGGIGLRAGGTILGLVFVVLRCGKEIECRSLM